jgi:hypothetical protein
VTPRRWLVALLVVCGALGVAAVPVWSWLQPRPHLQSAAAAAAPPFAQARPVWALDGTVHYGGRSFDVGPGVISAVTPASYGMFLVIGPRHSLEFGGRSFYTNGRTTVRVPGDPSEIKVSPDGRYAAWADYHGPRRLFGRIAQVVVIDLSSGRTVFHDSEGMGGAFDTNPSDRYEETPPTVLGFDDRHVYWSDAFDATHSWPISGGDPQRVRRRDVHVRDRTLGAPVVLVHGRVEVDPPVGYDAVTSPDGRSAVVSSGYRPTLTDLRSHRSTPLRGLDRSWTFGGWLPDSSFYALTDDLRRDLEPPPHPRRRGRLVRCQPATGSCATLSRVPSAGYVVLPGTSLG